MTTQSFSKDLLVLTADSQMKRVIETLLEQRRSALSISDRLAVDVVSHRHQDSGCRKDSGSVLNPRRSVYHKAMVIFDFHGSGKQDISALDLEQELEAQYETGGWGSDRVTFIIIDPELEAWVFGAPFQRLQQAVGWTHQNTMQQWLEANEYLPSAATKPPDPQGAIDAILYLQNKKRSGKFFADLARTINFNRCQDRAFQKFRSTLQRWFPAGG